MMRVRREKGKYGWTDTVEGTVLDSRVDLRGVTKYHVQWDDGGSWITTSSTLHHIPEIKSTQDLIKPLILEDNNDNGSI